MNTKKRPKGFGKRANSASLREKIEIVADRPDEDVLPYLENFMAQMKDIKPIEEISLLTQEDAKQAIATIDETLRQLNERLGVARSLRQLLAQTKR